MVSFRGIFKRCKSVDGILMIGISCLILWNMNKLYAKVKEGAFNVDVSKRHASDGSPTRLNLVPGQAKTLTPVVNMPSTSLKSPATANIQAKTNIPSVSNVLINQPDVNKARYGQNLKYVLNSPGLCRRQGSAADAVTLVILVTTGAPYFQARQNWRNSLQVREHKKVRVLFVVEKSQNDNIAAKLKEEHKQFGDVICMNFTADNKVAESLRCLSGLRWIQNFCPQTAYVLKVQINTLVMVSTVLEYLDNLPARERENLYSGGVIHRNAWAQRSGEWAVTKEEWPNDNYPDYVQYGVIFLSGKSASIMADTSRKTEVFKFPDVYFGILANEAADRIFALEPNDDFKFLRHRDVKEEFTDYCKMKKFLYIIGDNPGEDMQKGWGTLRDRKELLCLA